jgi:PHD/YefM family antitoxin component YafN of YafNO toxin-antitoxin module
MGSELTIPKQFTHGEELVIIRRQDYEQLKKHLAEVKDALLKIRRGEKELKEGKTRIIESLFEIRS